MLYYIHWIFIGLKTLLHIQIGQTLLIESTTKTSTRKWTDKFTYRASLYSNSYRYRVNRTSRFTSHKYVSVNYSVQLTCPMQGELNELNFVLSNSQVQLLVPFNLRTLCPCKFVCLCLLMFSVWTVLLILAYYVVV